MINFNIPPIDCEYTEIRIDVFINNQFSYSFYHPSTDDPVTLNNLRPGELVFIKVIPINEGSHYDPSYKSNSYRIPLDKDFKLSSIYLNGNPLNIHDNNIHATTFLCCNKINLYTLELHKTFHSGYYEILDGDKLITKQNLDSSLKFSIENNIDLNFLKIKVYIFTVCETNYTVDINLTFLRAKFETINHFYTDTKIKKLILNFHSSNSPKRIEVKIYSDKDRTQEIFSTFEKYQTSLVLHDFIGRQGYVSCDLYDDLGLSDSINYNYIYIPA